MLTHDPTVTVLCVDDEINILKSLRRVLRRENFQLLFADGGAKALSIMKKHQVDIVITDMKMPFMSGDVLLKHINDTWPKVKKVLLSGYTEKQALTHALNKGGVDCFIEKPWDNQELLTEVDAMSKQVLISRQDMLRRAKINRGYKKLKSIKQELEQQLYTADMQGHADTLYALVDAHPKLDLAFAKRVANTSTDLGRLLELDEVNLKRIAISGHLCELGLIGVNDHALKPFKTLSQSLQRSYLKQTETLRTLFNASPKLSDVRDILLNQFKQPSAELSIETRILMVARDYWRMRNGKWQADKMEDGAARQEIHRFRGLRYDDAVVEQFMLWQADGAKSGPNPIFNIADLREGMMLMSNVNNTQGALLLPKGHTLSNACVTKLSNMACSIDMPIQVRDCQ